MTLGNIRPRPYPAGLLRDLLRTCWSKELSGLPRPTILEAPLPEYVRMDLYNAGPHIVIKTGDIEENLIHIGYRNLEVSVPMEIEIHTAVNPDEINDRYEGMESHRFRNQVLYDYAEEIQRIILTFQHDPNIYLIADFEKDSDFDKFSSDSATLTDSVMLDSSQAKYGMGYLEAVGGSMMNKITYTLPNDLESEANPLPLIPRPMERLRVLNFWAAGGSDNVRLGVNMLIPELDDNGELTGSDVSVSIVEMPESDANVSNIGTQYTEFWIDFDSAINEATEGMSVYIYDNVRLEFEFPANETLYLDQLSFSTCEYQMLLYQGFRPNTDAGQGYFTGTTRATFRSVGDSIDYLQ